MKSSPEYALCKEKLAGLLLNSHVVICCFYFVIIIISSLVKWGQNLVQFVYTITSELGVICILNICSVCRCGQLQDTEENLKSLDKLNIWVLNIKTYTGVQAPGISEMALLHWLVCFNKIIFFYSRIMAEVSSLSWFVQLCYLFECDNGNRYCKHNLIFF